MTRKLTKEESLFGLIEGTVYQAKDSNDQTWFLGKFIEYVIDIDYVRADFDYGYEVLYNLKKNACPCEYQNKDVWLETEEER
jgi:hypothetical protein